MDLRSIIEKLNTIDSKKNLMEDAATIANNIKKAVVRWGTDEVAVYDAIAQLTSAAEWEQVKKVYAADGRDIEADIANDFGGAELDYVRGLLASKGIKSEILRIGEPTDHLTPVEPNTPPPPAAEAEGKSDDKNQGQRSTQTVPVDVATGNITDPTTKAWETAFGRPADQIIAWTVKKYPKLTAELVKEYLKSTTPVGDDIASLNQLDKWAKDPHTVKEPSKLDYTKLRMWENITAKPLSYIIAFATSLHQSDPYTYKREVTSQEVKEFLIKTQPTFTGTIDYDRVAAFKAIKAWASSETAVNVTPTTRDPKLDEIKRLLDKAEEKREKPSYAPGDNVWDPSRNTYVIAKESKLPIAKSLVESFGYILEAYKDLSDDEKKELDQLAIELEPFAKNNRQVARLIKAYKKLKGGRS
jgi:hypothetical protein